MTGDGVNDILALKAADCEYCDGIWKRCDQKMAKVVLLDSDFGKDAVHRGRRASGGQ